MSVFFRLICNDGTVGDNLSSQCWGFLKGNITENAEGFLKDMNEKEWARQEAQGKDYGDRWGHYHYHPKTYTRFLRELEEVKWKGVRWRALASGIHSIVIRRINFDDGAFDVVLAEYPKLFKGILKVDKKRGEITVDFNQHYAVLFNQLRLLKAFKGLCSNTAELIVANPRLSIFLLDIYRYGSRTTGDNIVFKTEHTTPSVIKEFEAFRDWKGGKALDNPKLTASYRGGCEKVSTNAFGSLVQPIRDGYESCGRYEDYYLPSKPDEFVELDPLGLKEA